MTSAGYFGTQDQIRLQKKSDRLTPWIMKTPGACVTGRVICADDPAIFGWPQVRAHLVEDGAFGFRWMSPAQIAEIDAELAGTGATLHQWQGFFGTAADIQAATAATVSSDLPAGLTQRTASRDDLPKVQAFLTAQGIAPLSTAALGGDLFRAAVQLIVAPRDRIVAAGWSGMPQNRHSGLANMAWVGLIAVDPQMRGQSLGARINALALMHAVTAFGAEAAIEFASAENAASIAMIRGSGLRPHQNVSAVATLDGNKLTR